MRSLGRWLPSLVVALAFVGVGLGLALGLGACAAFGGTPRGERLERMKRSPNYRGSKFVNLFRIARIRPVRALRSFLRGSRFKTPCKSIPVRRLTREDFARPPSSGLRVTWLGHSSLVVELDGVRILTDPVWSKRAGPGLGLGPKRFFAPPLPLDQLPKLDAVVISHDHYDHLDMVTIRRLAKTGVTFVVPLGVGAHLERWKVPASRIIELDWWQSATVGRVRLVATPARHGSGRRLTDRDATLWASWSMVGPKHRVFFSGDGGYSPSFAEIGRRLGPFDITLMESGAYNSEWSDFHLGPEQAVRAHRDLRGKVMLPIHWGTFVLAPHGWTEPAERLRVAANSSATTLVIPRPGQPIEPASPPPVTQWWPGNPWLTATQSPVVASQPAGMALLHRSVPVQRVVQRR